MKYSTSSSFFANTEILLILGLALFLLHMLTNHQYGFHQDEMVVLDNAYNLARVLSERGGDTFTFFDVASSCFDGAFHYDVAHSVLNDGEDFENGNTRANERSKRASKPGQTNLVRNYTKDR